MTMTTGCTQLGPRGTEALVALCQYVVQHGNVRADARFLAAALGRTVTREPLRNPGPEVVNADLLCARLRIQKAFESQGDTP